MRKLIAIVCVGILIVLLCGCGSKVPEPLKNPKTECLEVGNYKQADYVVPPNYRLMKDGIYAVLDENNAVTGYVKLIEENGIYRWVKTEYVIG